MLAYLSRYTHRVAISNSRLIAADATGVTFGYKDYRIEGPRPLQNHDAEAGRFIRRSLMHVLPSGYHRIRHCGLLASGTKTETIARIRELIATVEPVQTAHQPQPPDSAAATDQGDPPVPVLRRSHEHHRDLQPRLDTAIQTAAANRDQDRYVMITFPHLTDSKSRSSSPALDPPRRRSCKYAFAHVNVAIDLPGLPQNSRTCDRPIMRRNVVSQHAHRRRLPSPTCVVRKPP